jgi:dTDP-4-dehydrorhamnose reductase
MQVLILGGDGMLGHKAWQVLKNDLDVFLTVRGKFSELEKFEVFEKKKTICNIDASDFQGIERAIKRLEPSVVLNCIGIVKQRKEAKDFIKSIEINSLFPHRLLKICDKIGARLIHISTDCVFSGKKGNYSETDIPDPVDLYDRSKLLGEVTSGRALTIRTSLIGHELKTQQQGLVEWVLSNHGKTVQGYAKAIFSGFPTVIFSNILKDIILRFKSLKGLYHISSKPIDKYSLLQLINSIYGLGIKIRKNEEVTCDRSLNSSLFRKMTGFRPLEWKKMIEIMYEDSRRYDRRLRK